MTTVDATSAATAAATTAAAAAAAANSSSSASSGSGTTASSQAGLNSDYNQFLQLLTTELTNQDPDSPVDDNQIVNQTAQLSQVQQAIDTNTKLDTLIASYNAATANQGVGYIGKQVDVPGNQIDLSGSQGAIVYTLPANAASATVSIQDSTGATVYSAAGTTTTGRNQLLWNGANSTNGTTEPDGLYTFTVTAKDSAGNPVTATSFTSGTVTAVNSQSGTNTLSLGSLTVPMTNVQSVYTAGTNPSL